MKVIRVDERITKAMSTLGFLRISTPRSRGSHGSLEKDTKNSNKDFSKRPTSNWHGGNLDPDQVKRHYQGLKRAGFKDNNHVKGGMF